MPSCNKRGGVRWGFSPYAPKYNGSSTIKVSYSSYNSPSGVVLVCTQLFLMQASETEPPSTLWLPNGIYIQLASGKRVWRLFNTLNPGAAHRASTHILLARIWLFASTKWKEAGKHGIALCQEGRGLIFWVSAGKLSHTCLKSCNPNCPPNYYNL